MHVDPQDDFFIYFLCKFPFNVDTAIKSTRARTDWKPRNRSIANIMKTFCNFVFVLYLATLCLFLRKNLRLLADYYWSVLIPSSPKKSEKDLRRDRVSLSRFFFAIKKPRYDRNYLFIMKTISQHCRISFLFSSF